MKTYLSDIHVSTARRRPATERRRLASVLLAARSTFRRLPLQTLPDYGIGYATQRRGNSGIPGDLETDVQGRHRTRRCAPPRHAAHRALCPACETAAVGAGTFGTS